MDKRVIQDSDLFYTFFKILKKKSEKQVIFVQNIWRKKVTDESTELFNLCQNYFKKIKENDFSGVKLANELEILTKELINWNEDFISEKNDLFILSEFIENINNVIENFENESNYQINDEFWQTLPTDGSIEKTWKISRRITHWIKLKTFITDNKIRKILKKPARALKPVYRNFQLHLFLKYHFLPDVIFKVQTDWYDLQKHIVHLFDCRQMALEAVFSDIFSIRNTLKLFLSKDKNQSSSILKKLLFDLSELAECQSMLNTFFNEYPERNAEFFDKIESELLLKWNYAGTFILPQTKFSEKRIKRKLKNIEKENSIYDAQWQELLQKEAENRKKDLELFQLQIQTLKICIQTGKKFEDKILGDILPSFKEPEKIIFNSLNRFKKIETGSELSLKEEILSENRTIIHKLRRELLPASMDIIVKAELIKNLNSYHSFMRYTIDNLTDLNCIVKWRDWNGMEASVNYDYVSLEEIILKEIFNSFSKSYNQFVDNIELQLSQITRHISEIDQIIEFNLDSALELLETKSEDSAPKAIQVVLEGLERSHNRLKDIINKNYFIYKKIQKTLPHNTLLLNNSIQNLADNEKIIKLRIRITKVKTSQKVKDYFSKIIHSSQKLYSAVFNYFIKITRAVKSKILTIRKVTGLVSSESDLENELSLFITNTSQQIDKLPYVYRRLFKAEPLQDEHFFEGRMEDLKRIENEFVLWQKGHYGVTALVGEKGSGKTSLLNFAEQEFLQHIKTQRINLTSRKIYLEQDLTSYFKEIFENIKFNSLDELENNLNESTVSMVIIVEDIQNLFLRTVDGFEALERFLLLISRTSKNVFWLITCTIYSWEYLDRVLNISKFFQSFINLGRIKHEDIEKIILKSKKYKKLSNEDDRQDYLSKVYFEQLNNLAAGNISVAMKFWMSAIKEIEKDSLIISLENFDTSFLARLPAEEIFTLASVIQHEMMLAEHHSEIFDNSYNASLMLLTRMHNRGLLMRNPKGYYQVNFLLYRAIIRALTIRNIIH